MEETMSDPIIQDAAKQHEAQIATLAISGIYLEGALMDKLISKGILQPEDKRQLIIAARNQLARRRALGQLALDRLGSVGAVPRDDAG